MYIYHSESAPYAWRGEDGYSWTEILHQMELATAKGNKIDYFHFYIELPGRGKLDKKRSSPNFRKEVRVYFGIFVGIDTYSFETCCLLCMCLQFNFNLLYLSVS